jgi:hypothetical protein
VAAEALLNEQRTDILFKELGAIFLRNEREGGQQKRECARAKHVENLIKAEDVDF